ncbi:hypothetical protein P7K49_022509, partial [Saguinus oedipus]
FREVMNFAVIDRSIQAKWCLIAAAGKPLWASCNPSALSCRNTGKLDHVESRVHASLERPTWMIEVPKRAT